MRAALVLLAACAVDPGLPGTRAEPAPDATWEGAVGSFGDAWCGHLLDCEPGQYADAFDGPDACRRYVVELERPGPLGALYPDTYPADRIPVLRSCRVDLGDLACGITDLPLTCWAAFELPGGAGHVDDVEHPHDKGPQLLAVLQ